MNKQFCRVGNTKPNLSAFKDIEALKNTYNYFIEVIYKSKNSKEINASF